MTVNWMMTSEVQEYILIKSFPWKLVHSAAQPTNFVLPVVLLNGFGQHCVKKMKEKQQ